MRNQALVEALQPNARDRIFEAALARFAAAGYAGASVEEIVVAARITKPALYHYFGSKAGLFKELAGRALDLEFEQLKTAHKSSSEFTASLTAVASASLHFARSNPGFARLIFFVTFAGEKEIPDSARHAAKRERKSKLIRTLMKNGLRLAELDRRYEAHEVASAFEALLHHAAAGCRKSAENPEVNRLEPDRIVKLFLDGAAAKRSILFSR